MDWDTTDFQEGFSLQDSIIDNWPTYQFCYDKTNVENTLWILPVFACHSFSTLGKKPAGFNQFYPALFHSRKKLSS